MEVNLTGFWPTHPSSGMSSKAKVDTSSIMDSVQVFFYSVVFLVGSVGNGAVITITARQALSAVNCVFFLNLASADFLFSLSRIVPLLKNAFYRGSWPFGNFLCKANSFTKYLNMFCSVFLLAAISLDRAASVVYPVWSRNRRGPRLAWLSAVSAWLVAAGASLPFYFYRGVVVDAKRNETKCSLTLGDKESTRFLYLVRLVFGFLAPFVVIVACYGLIAVRLRRRRATIRSKKPFKVILVIVVTFFLCWAPYHLFLLLKLAGVKGQAVAIGLPLSSSLAYLNSCANPILYFFMGLDFRRGMGRFNVSGAFRRTLLEGTVHSFGGLSGHRKETPASSANELGGSTVVHEGI